MAYIQCGLGLERTLMDGDNIYYPVPYPDGQKAYTEVYISQIAQGILDVNSLSEEYRTTDMVAALMLIRRQLNEISTAIRLKLNEPSTDVIPIADMASAIMRIQTGETPIEFMSDLAAELAAYFGYSEYAYWGFKTSNDHYLLAIMQGQLQLQVRFENSGQRGKLAINIQIMSVPANFLRNPFTSALYPIGKLDFHPILPTELTVSRELNNSNFGTLVNAPFYNRDNSIYNLSSNNLPKVIEVFGNDNVVSMKDFIEGFKFGDLYNITTSGAIHCYFGNIVPWDVGYYSDVYIITNNSNRLIYNRAQGALIAYSGYWSRGTHPSGEYYAQKINTTGMSSSGFTFPMTIAELENAMFFNTCDILDENGEVVLAANITPEEMGIHGG